MTYVSVAPEHFLNVEPMIWSLKFQPSDFEQDHGLSFMSRAATASNSTRADACLSTRTAAAHVGR